MRGFNRQPSPFLSEILLAGILPFSYHKVYAKRYAREEPDNTRISQNTGATDPRGGLFRQQRTGAYACAQRRPQRGAPQSRVYLGGALTAGAAPRYGCPWREGGATARTGG